MDEKEKNSYRLKKIERERVREEERKRMRNERAKKTLIRNGLLVLVAVGIVYGIFLLIRAAGPEGEDYSTVYDIQGWEHIADGATHPAYNSNPPSSGWHYSAPAQGGFYEEPLKDEQVIHNLEHGDIWITYSPNIDDSAIEVLKSFAGKYVVVSMRQENEGDISLVAWGRVDTFNIENGLVDEGRIRDFIIRYDNRGPEKVRGI